MSAESASCTIEAIPSAADLALRPEAIEAVRARSRRAFLRAGMAASLTPAAAAALSSAAQGATNYAKQLPSLYTNSTARGFGEIQVNENTHAQIIVYAITTLGGTPRPVPTYQNIQFTTVQAFLTKSILFENTGAGAYFGGAPAISNPNVYAVASSIGLTESYQGGFLNSLGRIPLVPNGLTYFTPLTQAQVMDNIGPYIVSLNGGPPAAYDPVNKSNENDIAILNFALVAEFLEMQFYNNNVPVVFPGY